MPFLTQGKTNWKYIIIVIILAVIVGGGALGYYWWLKQEVKIPELKLPKEEMPEEITEDACKKLALEERIECFWNLKNKNPEICEKIVSIEFWTELKCDKAFEIARELVKIRKERRAIPSTIASTNESLSTYLKENFSDLPSFTPEHRFSIIKGNFDEDQNEEIIIESSRFLDYDLWLLKKIENNFYIVSWRKVGSQLDIVTLRHTKLYSLQMVNGLPKFIILESSRRGGRLPIVEEIEILTIEKNKGLFGNEIKEIWRGISMGVYLYDAELESSLPEDVVLPLNQVYEIENNFIDLDNDGNLEIVQEGSHEIVDSFGMEIRKEKIYQVLKWNEGKRKFVEETIQ